MDCFRREKIILEMFLVLGNRLVSVVCQVISAQVAKCPESLSTTAVSVLFRTILTHMITLDRLLNDTPGF